MKTCLHHSHKKRRDSRETRVGLLFFCCVLKCQGWPYRKYVKTAKIAASSDDFYCGNYFNAVLAIFVLIAMVQTFETVEKIARVEKDYHECYLCVTVCIATTY